MPNGSGAGAFAATTGFATTTNLTTGNTFAPTVPFDPGPASPNFFQGSFAISANPSGNHNPINLTGPWTITFENAGTSPTNVSVPLPPLTGSELPFVNSVTLSGTSANPTFSWTPPMGIPVNGYKIDIYQNDLVSNVTAAELWRCCQRDLASNGAVLYCSSSRFCGSRVWVYCKITNYTIAIVARQTRNGLPATGSCKNNVNAVSFAYSSFQTLPSGIPPVNLPIVTLVGNQVVFGFSLSVQPGITYYIDPEVATGYCSYETGTGGSAFVAQR